MVADHKYGTTENFVACQERGITTHMGERWEKRSIGREPTIFGDEAFTYDPLANIYRCPAGQTLRPRRVHPVRHTSNTRHPPESVRACVLRAQCTRSSMGALCTGTKNKRSWM